MRIQVTAFSFFILAATLSSNPKDKDYGPLVFSYMETRGAFSSEEFPKTGIEIYMKASSYSKKQGSDITIIEFRYGTDPKIDTIYSRSDDYRLTLQEIGFSSFDWESERQRAEEKRQKNESTAIIFLDGSEYEIRYEFDGQSFLVRDWNIGEVIDTYAPYSEEISKLKAVVDESARLFGRIRLN